MVFKDLCPLCRIHPLHLMEGVFQPFHPLTIRLSPLERGRGRGVRALGNTGMNCQCREYGEEKLCFHVKGSKTTDAEKLRIFARLRRFSEYRGQALSGSPKQGCIRRRREIRSRVLAKYYGAQPQEG